MTTPLKHALRAALTLGFCAAATTPAIAIDPMCNQLEAAVLALRTQPVHIYMTETQSFSNQAMAKSAAQIGMGGTKQSEEISTGKDVYVLNDGKWIDMQVNFAAMQEDKDSDPDAKETLDKIKCTKLPDETVDGQVANVYLKNSQELGIADKVWISKTTNLVLRTEMTNDQGAMKIFTVSRYAYGAVQAPAHSTTMKDIVKSDSSR